MKQATVKFASIFLAVCLLFSSGPMKTINANDQTVKEMTLINNDDLKVSVTMETNEENIIWSVHYNKLKETETTLLVRALDNEVNLAFSSHKEWEEKVDGWYQETTTTPSSGMLSIVSATDLESLELQIGLQTVDHSEPFEFESFNINVSDFIGNTQPEGDQSNDLVKPDQEDTENEGPIEVVEGEDGETILIIDSLDKVEAAKDEILRLANTKIDNYIDPFEYVNNETGSFPKHNTDVFIGGNNSKTTLNYNHAVKSPITTEPDSINAYGNSRDFFNGYHFYPQATGEGVLTKKTVKPTAVPNQFEVELDIIGGNNPQSNPIDIVLVLDKSTSMTWNVLGGANTSENNPSRWKLLQDAVASLAEDLLVSGNDIRMGMTSFGTASSKPWADLATFGTSKSYFTDNSVTLKNNPVYKGAVPNNSGTPTFFGIDAGMKVLEHAKPEATKFIILLTDGVATYSPGTDYTGWENGIISTDGNTTANKERYTLTNITTNWPIGRARNFFTSSGTTQNHTDKTITRIQEIKRDSKLTNVKYIGMGLGAQTTSNGEYMKQLLGEFGTHGFFDGTSAAGIKEAFNLIKKEISQNKASFVNGLLVDPMSEYVSMMSGTFKTSALSVTRNGIDAVPVRNTDGSINAAAPQYAKNVVVEQLPNATNDEIKLNSMTLGSDDGKRLGYRINYTIQLDDGYLDGLFYPTNGPTRAADNNSVEAVGFAVPSVRVPHASFEFKKVGEDGLALAGAVFELRREDVLIDTITSDENGVLELDDLIFGNYVLKEIEAPLGFELLGEIPFKVVQGPPVHNGVLNIEGLDAYKDSEGIITIKNRLADFEINILKIDNFGNAVKTVRFKLVGPDTNIEIGGSGANSNEFNFSKLRPGTYTLSETSNPDNFVTMDDVIFIIGDDGLVTIDGTAYDGAMSAVGNIIYYTAVNNIKGILPETGSSAMLRFQIAALSLVGLAAVVGTYGIYRQRRYR